MAYIPEDAKWYLAEIIEEFTIEDDLDTIVHINLVLVRADSPEEAYTNALDLGKEGEMIYQNTDNKQVTVTFRGLRDLNVIHDELEHGAELIYEERLGLSKEEVNRLVRDKEDLGIFTPYNVDD